MVFHMNHPPRPRNRRVIGWHLVQSYPQKVPQPQRIRCPPRYPPFAVDALEISDQQQAEIPSWRQTGPPHLLRVEARTLLLHVLVKAALLQQPVQLLVERMPHRPRQLRVRDPQFLLSSLLLFSTHSHAQILRISAVDHTIFFLKEPRLSPRTASRPWQKGFVHTAAGEIKIMIRTACEDSGIGTDAHSCSARTRIAIQNRNRIARASADSPCRPRGVPLPSNCRITSARLKPPR